MGLLHPASPWFPLLLQSAHEVLQINFQPDSMLDQNQSGVSESKILESTPLGFLVSLLKKKKGLLLWFSFFPPLLSFFLL